MAVYGIDLGTTYSCLAKFEGGQTTVIQSVPGEITSLASAVYFGEGGETVVGDEAKAYYQTEGHRVIQFVKREIGKPVAPHEIDGNSYNAIEISALILKKIKKYAEEQGEIVKDVVITCPAYFGNEERDATKKAGILAGFNVLELINEPTAAAISYAYSQKEIKDEVVCVYDLGGGTFDVTVLKIETRPGGAPACTVLATDGDDQLGGKDWDTVLFNLLCDKFKEENGLDSLDLDGEAAIRANVEKTKKALSTRESVIARAVIDGSSLSCEITRQEFEDATSGLLTQTTDCLDRVLHLPALKGIHISRILLVGGSSNMPQVSKTLKARYGETGAMAALMDDSAMDDISIPVYLNDPEAAVCKGAAIFASMLKGAKKSSGFGLTDEDYDQPKIEIHDIASRTFGVDTSDRDHNHYISNLIYKGDEIPSSVTATYNPLRDNQPGVLFYIYESIIETRGDIRLNGLDRETGEIKDPNPAWGVKLLGKLYLKFPPNTTTDVGLITTMSASGSGIHVRVENSRTHDVEEVDIEFKNNQIDMDDNQINALTIE